MAQYDGSIRINTEIQTKQAQIQLMALQNRIAKTADKVDRLCDELDALEDVRIPTQAFKDLEKDIKKAEAEYEKLQAELNKPGKPTEKYKALQAELEKAQDELKKLIDEQTTWEQLGVPEGSDNWNELNEKVADASDKVDELGEKLSYLEESGEAFELKVDSEKVDTARQKVDELKKKMEELKASGEDFVLGVDTDEYAKKTQQLEYAENDLELLNEKYDLQNAKLETLNGNLGGTQGSYSRLSEVVKKLSAAFGKMGNVIQKSTIGAFKKLRNIISGTFKKGVSLVNSFAGKIKDLAQKYMPRFRKETEKTGSSINYFGRRIKELVMSALIFNQISAAFRAMSNGMKEGFGNLFDQVDDFRLRVNTLRASCLTLKNALAGAFRPLVEIALPYIQKAVEYITMLVGNLGQLFAALTGQETYTKAIKMTADYFEKEEKAAKKAKKAIEGYLSPLDEINKYTKNQKDDENNLDEPQVPMFEEVPIDGRFKEMAKKIKDVLKKLFKPLKEAWDREGKFVMDAWKYALGEVWKLIKDIGRDFLKVWQQPETIDMLSDMLHIVGDIGLIVGNLAKNFREAWNYNNTGLRILENIRDIFAAIIHNIRLAADRTVEWTKTLDFRPLLTSIEALTRSLIRFADFLSGTMADFYTEFILPLASWTLSEKGLPRLFNILTAFMNEINWEGLRSALKSLYQALEPYAEEIGNGLLDFIEKMKTEGVEFFNFLPGAIQRAADALRAGDLPAAFYEFGNISGEAVKTAFNIIKLAIESVPWGEIGTMIASFINGIPWGKVTGALFGALSASITSAIDFLYNLFTTIRWEEIGHTFGANLQRAWNAIDWQKAGLTVGAGIKGILDFMLATVQELDWGQIGRDIGTFLSAIPWGDILGNVFAILGTVFGGLLEGLKQSLPGRILTTIAEVIASLKLASFLSSLLVPILNAIFGFPVGTIAGLIITGIAALAPVLFNLGGDIINGLMNGIGSVVRGIGQWIKSHIFDPFINGFKSAFGIHSPSTVMAEMGKCIIDGLRKGISDVFGSFLTFWDTKKKEIINKFNDIKEKFLSKGKDIVSGMKDGISNLWSGFTSFLGDRKRLIIEKFNDIKDKFMEKGKAVVSGIKDGVSNAWSGFSRYLKGKKDSILSIFSGIGRSMRNVGINIVSGIIDGIRSAWNTLKDWASSIKNMFTINVSGSAGGTTAYTGYSRSYSNSSYSPYMNNPAFASLNTAQIPKLATGAVIPANKEFLAVLGDQKRGTNVEAPLDMIKQAQRESILEVLSELGITGNRGNSNPQTIVIKQYLDRKQVAQSVIKEGKIQQMATGNNMFMLGTT